jgi:hypothetical protein
MLAEMMASAAGEHTGAPTIHEIVLADDPERWAALGFSVTDHGLRLGAVRLSFVSAPGARGILGWSLRGVDATDLDGVRTERSSSPEPAPAPSHANGVTALDHVVAMTPALDRTVAALEAAGLDLRRIREEPTPAGAPRQAFFRLGAEILEVVQEPEHAIERGGAADRPARLWGLALIATDLDRTVSRIAPHAGTVRPAVQHGRRIATIRRTAGLAVPVALMSPPPATDQAAARS